MTDLERYHDPTPVASASPIPLTEHDLTLIERQAAILARSDLVGPLKGKPADVALVGINAHALQIPFTSGLTDLYPIEQRVSPSSRLRVGLARRAGHEVWFEESTDEAATCCLRRRGENRIHRLRYTIEQARRAKLTDKEKTWGRYPAAMLRAASARQLVNMAAQEVLLGIPNVVFDDELAARGIDVDDLEHPEDPVGSLGPGDQPSADDAPILTPSAQRRADLRQAIERLKPHQREWLFAQAKGNIPNIDGPRFQMVHVDRLNNLLGEAAQQPDPGPPPERIQQTMDQVIDAQHENDDPTRPFE